MHKCVSFQSNSRLTHINKHMKLVNKLAGASVIAGMVVLSASSLSAKRTADQGKNFTVSDSPETTVFNLKTPSVNRHITDSRRRSEPAAPAAPAPVAAPAPAAVSSDCGVGVVSDYVDKYLVRLEKSAPSMVALNEPYSYNYTATAKDKVKKVVVEEQIPDGTVYVSSSPEAEIKGSTVTWTLYNLSRGESVPLSLTVRPTTVADLSSCATIVAYPEACTTTTVGSPELTIVKTTPDEQVLLGAGVPWNITVTNVGNFCAYDVVVTDTLPSGVSHSSGNTQLVSQLGTLAPGQSRDVSINTTAIQTGSHCNVARVDSSNANSAEDDACIVVVEPGLEVVKDGTQMQFVGKKASYTITATNTGSLPLNDVVVTDNVPSQNKLLTAPGARISGNTATWTTSLAPGQSKSFDLTVRGLQAGTYCNQVAAESEYNLSDSDDACTEWRGYPALLIEVIDTEDPLLVGDETTYVIQITNQGTAPDTNVTLDVALPSNLEVVSAAGDTQGTISGRNIKFAPVSILNAKEIVEFRVLARAVAEGDARFRAKMNSDLLKSPVPEEEATQVY